jgi:hypothetical protein
MVNRSSGGAEETEASGAAVAIANPDIFAPKSPMPPHRQTEQGCVESLASEVKHVSQTIFILQHMYHIMRNSMAAERKHALKDGHKGLFG